MNIIDKVITDRINALLVELEDIATEIANEINDKTNSQTVKDFTTASEIDNKYLRKIGVIQLKIHLLQGLL